MLTMSDIANKVSFLVDNQNGYSFFIQKDEDGYYLENDFGTIEYQFSKDYKIESVLEDGSVILHGRRFTGYISTKVSFL